MGLNTIKSDNNWGTATADLNNNFASITAELEKLKAANQKFKGFYTSATTLNEANPRPSVGDSAWVGEVYPGVVYECNSSGVWANTNKAPVTPSVSLADYVPKTLLDVRTTEYNVSVQHPSSGIDGTNKFTLAGAIALVPSPLRTVALKCSFLNASGTVETWEFQGGAFTATNSWAQGGAGKLTELSTVVDNASLYPFTRDFTNAKGKGYENAIIDILIELNEDDVNEKIGFYTLERGNGSTVNHYIRFIYLNKDGAINPNKGNKGVAAIFVGIYNEPEAVAGKIIDKIKLDMLYGSIISASVVLDWSKLTVGASSMSGREISPRCYKKTEINKMDYYGLTPLPNQKVWNNKTYFPNLDWMKDFVVSLTLSSETYDKTKNIAINTIRVDHTGGRTFVTIAEVDNIDGNATTDSTKQLCLYDNATWVEPAEQNGHKYQTLSFVQRNNSNVVGTMVVDWSVVPRTIDNFDFYRDYSVRNTLLSVNVWGAADDPSGYSDTAFQLGGVTSRLITSDGYNINGTADYLLIYCHGNGQNTESGIPSSTALAWFRSHKISFAVTKIQDEISPPFTTEATGWGNHIAYTRIVKLYSYLMNKYNFHKTVIIAGGSMGGLTAGEIAYKRPFPVAFYLGIGPVPGVKITWNNAASRRPPIRNAFGMASDGSEDANLSQFVQGYDWYDMGMVDINSEKVKFGFPNVYLYYGVDSTFNVDFGGVTQYKAIRDALLKSGVYCVVGTDGSTSHASPTLYDYAIAQGVFKKELGIV